MCTYNGAKYLPEQLESIIRQTQPVDELVVCDDGSTDNTLEVLRTFAQTAPFPVQIHQNPVNLGSTKNFEQCLLRCRGEIIFLCDQDDAWYDQKVARTVAYLEAHPEKDAVFTNARVMDGDSTTNGRTIWEEVEFIETQQELWNQGRAHEILFKGFVATGATMAIRKRCLARLLPFPTHVRHLIHDAWITLALSLENKIGFIPECLSNYRMHALQQVGFGAKVEPVRLRDRLVRDRSRKLRPILEKAEELQGMYQLLREQPFVPQEKLAKLYSSQKHFEKRASLPANRLLRIGPVLTDVLQGHYRFSSRHWWLPALGDLFE